MPKKDIRGDKNPFYGKKHSEESKKKIGGSVVDYTGDKNPFYGKRHSKDTIDKIKKSLNGKMAGDKNPFYGKKHTEEVILRIKETNSKNREINKAAILQRQLDRLNLTYEKLLDAYNIYCSTHKNADDIQSMLNVDKRVFFKYIVHFNIASEEEIKKVKDKKRMNNSKSSKEMMLYEKLCQIYGKENVISSYKLGRYFYDILLKDILLIEYDGFYWHKIRGNKNDILKNEVARKSGFYIYRVEEDEKRFVNFDQEIKKIQEVLDEIYSAKNIQQEDATS
jgi:hypothetical protein